MDLRSNADPVGAVQPLPVTYACAGCGYAAPADRPVPLRCPQTAPDDDIDHVMGRVLDPARLTFPAGTEANPFIRFRTLLHPYHLAMAHGWSDARYVELVERLDAAIVAIDGRGFRVTPFQRQATLSERLGFAHDGGVLVKDETGNVSGSHKARHLMGTLLELEVADAITGTTHRPRLAIASCGNAALAAAVLAAAAGRELDVFVPADANPTVVTRLAELGAHLTIGERQVGFAGDPTVEQLRAAIEGGAIGFTCQGPENGLAVEGGLTLAWELATELAATDTPLDRLFVQVGGGALASACVQGLDEARRLEASRANPTIHPVQAATVAPLARAFERLAHRLDTDAPSSAGDLKWAAQHRSAFMWPWETEPHSVATGILDDETYDWLAVVRGTLVSGGSPVVVDEATLVEANEIARESTGINVDPTGSAGLAGLLDLRRRALVAPGETVAVIFTGAQREAAPDTVATNSIEGDQR